MDVFRQGIESISSTRLTAEDDCVVASDLDAETAKEAETQDLDCHQHLVETSEADTRSPYEEYASRLPLSSDRPRITTFTGRKGFISPQDYVPIPPPTSEFWIFSTDIDYLALIEEFSSSWSIVGRYEFCDRRLNTDLRQMKHCADKMAFAVANNGVVYWLRNNQQFRVLSYDELVMFGKWYSEGRLGFVEEEADDVSSAGGNFMGCKTEVFKSGIVYGNCNEFEVVETHEVIEMLNDAQVWIGEPEEMDAVDDDQMAATEHSFDSEEELIEPNEEAHESEEHEETDEPEEYEEAAEPEKLSWTWLEHTSWAGHSWIDENGHMYLLSEDDNKTKIAKGVRLSDNKPQDTWAMMPRPELQSRGTLNGQPSPSLTLTTPEEEKFWPEDMAYYPGQVRWANLDDDEE